MTLILKGVHALFQREGREQYGVDVRVEGNRIAGIGTNLPVPAGARVVECRGKIAIPGLVNTHHHFFQILTRCLPAAQDLPLFDWLHYHYGVWQHVDAEMMDAAARLAMAELLLTGTTTTSDHLYLFPRPVTEDLVGLEMQAARELGIRFVGTRGAMTLGSDHGGLPPMELVERDDDVLAESEAAVHRWHDPAPFAMHQLHLAPCSPFNVSPELLRETAQLARRLGVRLHTHLAETQDEVDYCARRFGQRPLEFMEELGWVGDDIWYAHGIHFTDPELDRLAACGCGIAHCPSSNMRLGSGVARVPEMIRRGIPVGLAVDGSASNDTSDMLGELRGAMLVNRVAWGSAALSARQTIALATTGSARILGRPELGTLEVGQAADLALFDFEQLQYAGAADPIAALLFCGYRHTAWMVMVNGEVVVEDGHLARGDEEHIRRRAVAQAERLWRRAKL